MSSLEWIVFVAAFGLGYAIYRVEVVLRRIEALLARQHGS
jgi:hypothetical protein